MERELIERIRKTAKCDQRLNVGIGDDAAILAASSSPFIVTVDLLTEGVDFLVDQVEPRLIGRKALAVNLSDLAAMGAVPHSVFVAVALPRTRPESLAAELTQGILELAEQYNVLLAGGDVNVWDGGLVVSITAVGTENPHGRLLRSHARVGDILMTTGRFGASILGRQFLFEPRIREAALLVDRYGVDAGMDVSDGLLLDLTRFAEESHVGFILDDAALPIHDDVRRAACYVQQANELIARTGKISQLCKFKKNLYFPVTDEAELSDDACCGVAAWLCGSPSQETGLFHYDPLEHALSDGEDFELLLAVRPETAALLLQEQPLAEFGTELTRIGEFVPEHCGKTRRTALGDTIPAEPHGFLHELEDRPDTL